MGYRTLRACIEDLDRTQQLIRIDQEVDPYLEMAEIHRRVYDVGGPAIYFSRVKGSPFPAVSNIYGTNERTEFLFRDTLAKVEKVIALKADPSQLIRSPFKYLSAPLTALTALPRKQRRAPVRYGETTIDKLPQIVSWPDDGGAFITLPQVCTLPPDSRQVMQSNLGMYRVQLSGNDYEINREVGMHYQLHRGIGVHHTAYNEQQKPFRASIFVGGPPSHALAAIFPLPEGLSELTFAGMLGGRRFHYHFLDDCLISNDADFVITGTILKETKKPEGPFGDHLGYYSLCHDFPVMQVDRVYHRKDPIWHFTVVGRPPQEDTGFGHIIHKLVGPLLPQELPGVKAIHAVDAAGVHPLLLAIGSERYMPFRTPRPEEILIQANRILGSGQTSLAKYLIIAAANDAPALDVDNIPQFFRHVLHRIDWRRDLHFQTETTIDTLDYSGTDWNAGSKVIMACHGPVLRTLGEEIPNTLALPAAYHDVRTVLPGILAISAPAWQDYRSAHAEVSTLIDALAAQDLQHWPLVLLVDDAAFVQAHLNNFLWVVFTRSNPSHDIYGVGAFQRNKHWGCQGPLIIDARIKSHHAPVLERDPEVTRKVEDLIASTPALRSIL